MTTKMLIETFMHVLNLRLRMSPIPFVMNFNTLKISSSLCECSVRCVFLVQGTTHPDFIQFAFLDEELMSQRHYAGSDQTQSIPEEN